MKIYRIVKKEYATDLSGEGARLFGGRWNKVGDAMLYFSESLSLCLLEVLVHLDFKLLSTDYVFIEAELPDKTIVDVSNVSEIDEHWNSKSLTSRTQLYGSNWLTSKRSLALSVPSAVVPQERNVLVNPKHELISKMKIIRTETLVVDQRVLS